MANPISNRKDFVELFPPELSNVLFSYLPDRDLFAASQCCRKWRNTINNDQQWLKRCLRRGWTTDLTSNEAVSWKDKSHVDSLAHRRTSLLPTPELNLKLEQTSTSEGCNQLHPLCAWAIYHRQRLRTLQNWRRGNYIIHELSPAETETDVVIISDSACNGNYLVIGTTAGYVIIWNVTGVPQLVCRIKPNLPGKEVKKVAIIPSDRLIILYEGAIIHVYEKSRDCNSSKELFKLIRLANIFLGKSDNQKPSLEAEVWTETDVALLMSNTGELDEEKYLKMFAAGIGKVQVDRDILLSVSDEVVVISSEGESSYILWNLNTDLDYDTHHLLDSYRIMQVILCADLLVLSVEQQCSPEKYGIITYEIIGANQSLKTVLLAETTVPKLVDEIICDRNYNEGSRSRFAIVVCSHDGLIGAYCITTKKWIFLNEFQTPVDNLTASGEILFYQDCTEYNIVALSWLGTPFYTITGHICPIRRLRCTDQFIVSGGAARELMVWEKGTGQLVHRVYRQPSRIVNMYVGPTCILTVGKDDSPVLIGYL